MLPAGHWAELPLAELLDLAELTVQRRRQAEVEDLHIVAAWARDPLRRPTPGPRHRTTHLGRGPPDPPRRRGHARAVRVLDPRAGAGTRGERAHVRARPGRRAGPDAPAAETLGGDLCPGLPGLAGPQGRPADTPAARRPGRQVVDAAVAEAVSGESPGRVLAICEAKVIAADPAAHAERVEAQRRRRYVSLVTHRRVRAASRHRPGQRRRRRLDRRDGRPGGRPDRRPPPRRRPRRAALDRDGVAGPARRGRAAAPGGTGGQHGGFAGDGLPGRAARCTGDGRSPRGSAHGSSFTSTSPISPWQDSPRRSRASRASARCSPTPRSSRAAASG